MTSAPDPMSEPSGIDIAVQWAALPPEHLKAALQRLEPAMKRAHEARMEALRISYESQRRRHELDLEQARRDYVLRWAGLVAGFTLAGGMLLAAAIAVLQHQPWVASAWGSTGMIGVIGTFVPKFRTAQAVGKATKTEIAAQDA